MRPAAFSASDWLMICEMSPYDARARTCHDAMYLLRGPPWAKAGKFENSKEKHDTADQLERFCHKLLLFKGLYTYQPIQRQLFDTI